MILSFCTFIDTDHKLNVADAECECKALFLNQSTMNMVAVNDQTTLFICNDELKHTVIAQSQSLLNNFGSKYFEYLS